MNIGNILAAAEIIKSLEIKNIFKNANNIEFQIRQGTSEWSTTLIPKEVKSEDVIHRETVSSYLLKERDPKESTEDRVEAEFFLRNKLESYLETSILEERENEYWIGGYIGKSRSIEIRVKLHCPIYIVKVAKMIRDGYTLEDYPGEYINVFTAQGAVRTITSGSCSCGKIACNHKKFAQTYHEHKREFLKNNIARIK